MTGTHTAHQIAARAGLPLADLQHLILFADQTPPAGPNRATRRAKKNRRTNQDRP